MKFSALILLFSVLAWHGSAQDYARLNTTRIQANKTGMTVLGSWGAANLVTGVAGYATADQQVWKSFHGMNAIWGAVNGLIAVGGYMGAVKESRKAYNYDEAYSRYKSNKRMFLINAGLDVVYIGTGIAVGSINPAKNPGLYLGFGRSVAMQGVALLLFDCTMYSVHQSKNKKWIKAISGLTMTGNSIGYVYRF